MATIRNKRNAINKITIDGAEFTNPETLKEAVEKNFEDHCNKCTTTPISDIDYPFKVLSSQSVEFLNAYFSEEEVWNITSCAANKAPSQMFIA